MSRFVIAGRSCAVPLIAALVSLTPRIAAAKPECAEGALGDLTLQGRIGDDVVDAYFTDGYPAVAPEVYGVFVYPDTWSPSGDDAHTSTLSLHGKLSENCEMQLEEEHGSEVIANWKVRLIDFERIEGTRFGASEQKVRLEPGAPVDCDPSGGWRRFASTDWPITFEYPNSWRLEERDGGIYLECPDPEWLFFGGRPIWLEQGAGKPIDVTLENGRRAKELAPELRRQVVVLRRRCL